MFELHSYNSYLEMLLRDVDSVHSDDWRQKCHRALNGGPTQEIRNNLDLKVRRGAGIFFTDNSLAKQLLSGNRSNLLNQVYFDPTCGAGDLLLTVASGLPLFPTVEETIYHWGTTLHGLDIFEDFVRMTKARLALLSIARGAAPSALSPTELGVLLPNIRQGDCLSDRDSFSSADWIILNPPYNKMMAPKTSAWASGAVTAAAVFTEKAIRQSRSGTRVSAILPDVLRSGTRYRRWRETIYSISDILTVDIAGRFDKDTNVDVFILHLTVGTAKKESRDWTSKSFISDHSSPTISDHFNVHVGSVVPHRDTNQGPTYPYIHARTATDWQTISHLSEERNYSGTVFTPPFVIVKRTSSPRDKYRCRATIINDKRNVAVENHLIVLQPKDRSLLKCENLIRTLKAPDANTWFNNRIRCRHLTVSAMREYPLTAFKSNIK